MFYIVFILGVRGGQPMNGGANVSGGSSLFGRLPWEG